MNPIVKRILEHSAYLIGFVALLIFIGKINSYFANMYNDSFRIYPWLILIILMNLPIGLYLGFPKFLKEYKTSGKWNVNFYKVVFVVLPMIYISFYWYLPFSYPIPKFLTYTKSIFSFGTAIAGFYLIDSFSKK